MPYFNGQNIFGYAVSMTTADNPRSAQENAYPGLSGVESLDQGFRGRFTICEGILIGPDRYSVGAQENLFRSYNDGTTYILIDVYGYAWLNVKLDSFEPQGKGLSFSGSGNAMRKYTARFRHLT